MPKTDEQKAREREAERQRQARRTAAKKRLDALPQSSRDAVRRRADTLEANHTGPKVTAVTFLEQALTELDTPAQLRMTGSGALKIVDAQGDPPPQPKPGPREKSVPKEKGRPTPQTKDPEQLAKNAGKARGGRSAVKATVAVEVPTGTAYCPACDKNKPEGEFWPAKVTAKSKRRRICRPCYNAEWKAWDERRRAAKAAEKAAV